MIRSSVRAFAIAGLALGAAGSAFAQEQTDTRGLEVITSKRLNQLRTIFIATPEEYPLSKASYPVLVLLDADDFPQYELALASVRFLASRTAIPKMIVVGIPNGSRRTHDLTPPPTGKTATDFPTAGGAAAFAGFVVDEVLPLVREKYRTLPTTILAGHSFGGLFALAVAAQNPGVFKGVIAMSPALWWNDSSLVVTYSDILARSRGRERIFVTSGGLEPTIDRNTGNFATRLDALSPATVVVEYRRYPEDTHMLTPAPSLADGLRFVFEPVSLAKLPISRLGPGSDSATIVRAVLQTEEVYHFAARSLGLPDLLPENVLNGLGYGVLDSMKNPALAAWVFGRNVLLYPESANVYDSLGDALLAGSDTTGARAQFQRAIDTAIKLGQPVADITKQKIAALARTDAAMAKH
ncbi:MAG TPA: alpha/beta hydrolase-fold protein [Gemmatimonadaceae bacterium]|nr:alpha/beta hydrolase-fold protein [Gemmatimonadaceae bacterium]